MDNRMLMNFIEHLYKEGFMKEYSKKHFIIKALNGKIEYFNKYPQLIRHIDPIIQDCDIPRTFIMNLSKALYFFHNIFLKKS